MNTLELEKSSQQALVSETSLLDKAIAATKQTEPDKVKELLSALTNNALKGSITFDRNIIKTLNNTIGSIDKLLSTQLAEIMHDESFSKLEGSWRGIQHLVNNSSTSNELKIKVINISKKELNKDFH